MAVNEPVYSTNGVTARATTWATGTPGGLAAAAGGELSEHPPSVNATANTPVIRLTGLVYIVHPPWNFQDKPTRGFLSGLPYWEGQAL